MVDDDDPSDADDDLADVVPVALLAPRPPRRRGDDTGLSAHTFATLKDRAVVVVANGFIYRGVLKGADEDDLYLRGELRWWVLPLSSIRSVVLDAERDRNRDDDDDDPRGPA